ncbi:uncharacterized protein LOC116578397 [Mustela erminea]|uniref:uncharacterized protein LOC116578397 n=1 Tax=Mustela erminea TaxID=36723 RepID=UPI0013875A12|nr:uncharacterized protein LOC116578397 [Mustela erminea]
MKQPPGGPKSFSSGLKNPVLPQCVLPTAARLIFLKQTHSLCSFSDKPSVVCCDILNFLIGLWRHLPTPTPSSRHRIGQTKSDHLPFPSTPHTPGRSPWHPCLCTLGHAFGTPASKPRSPLRRSACSRLCKLQQLELAPFTRCMRSRLPLLLSQCVLHRQGAVSLWVTETVSCDLSTFRPYAFYIAGPRALAELAGSRASIRAALRDTPLCTDVLCQRSAAR